MFSDGIPWYLTWAYWAYWSATVCVLVSGVRTTRFRSCKMRSCRKRKHWDFDQHRRNLSWKRLKSNCWTWMSAYGSIFFFFKNAHTVSVLSQEHPTAVQLNILCLTILTYSECSEALDQWHGCFSPPTSWNTVPVTTGFVWCTVYLSLCFISLS